MYKINQLAGAFRSGLFFRALIAIGVAELTLAMSIVLGLVFSLVFLLLPYPRFTWTLTGYVKDCKPQIDKDLAAWQEKQNSTPINALIGTITSKQSIPTGVADISYGYQIKYVNLTLHEIYDLWVHPDTEHPLPTALRNDCDLRAIDFGFPAHSAQVLLPICMSGWYLAIVVLAVIGQKFRRQDVRMQTAAARMTPQFFVQWISLGMVTAIAAILLSELLSIFNLAFKNAQLEQLLEAPRSALWIGLFVLVVGPIFEEILFRGILLRAFISNGLPVFGAVVVSISFAGIHIIGNEQNSATMCFAASIFVLSLVLCWAYYRTRSIWSSILTHMTHNAIVFTWMFFN
ncbi:MAG: lysostaphin resistance A-like protein [Rudaea sp.]